MKTVSSLNDSHWTRFKLAPVGLSLMVQSSTCMKASCAVAQNRILRNECEDKSKGYDCVAADGEKNRADFHICLLDTCLLDRKFIFRTQLGLVHPSLIRISTSNQLNMRREASIETQEVKYLCPNMNIVDPSL